MGLLKRIICGGDSDKGGEQDDYDVCEHHDHDRRDFTMDRLEAQYNESGPWTTIVTDVIPGTYLGVKSLVEVQLAPCRDCPDEREREEVIERWIVYCEDGEIETMSYSFYKNLVEMMEETKDGVDITESGFRSKPTATPLQ